jgi:hypothetical protein
MAAKGFQDFIRYLNVYRTANRTGCSYLCSGGGGSPLGGGIGSSNFAFGRAVPTLQLYFLGLKRAFGATGSVEFRGQLQAWL